MMLFNNCQLPTRVITGVGDLELTLEAEVTTLVSHLKELSVVTENISNLGKLETTTIYDDEVYELTYNIIRENLRTKQALTLESSKKKHTGILERIWKAIRMAWEKVKQTAIAIYKWIRSLFVDVNDDIDIVKFAEEYKDEIKKSSMAEGDKGDLLVLMHNALEPRKHLSYMDLAENFNIDIEDLFESIAGNLDLDFRTITTNYHVKKGELFIERKTPSVTQYDFKSLLKIKGIFETAIGNTETFIDSITRASNYKTEEELNFVQPMVGQAGTDIKILLDTFGMVTSRLGVVMYVMDSVKAGKLMPKEKETIQFIEKVKL